MSSFTELRLTCPHCGVAGEPVEARVSSGKSGLGWAICDAKEDAYIKRGIVTCEACKRPFAYELDAVPVVRVAPIIWRASA